jgi:glycosyl transferase family 25
MSLFLKHIFVYKEISEKYNEALILEDDVILGDDFMNKLSIYMSQLPSDYDMLFVGEGLVNMHVPSDQLKPGVNIYETSADPTCWGYGGSSKCSDSYIVSKKCATTLINYVWKEKTSLPVDHWINLAVKENNLKVFWAEPTIAQQGTQIGVFKTSIEPTDINIHSYPKIEPIIQNRFLM